MGQRHAFFLGEIIYPMEDRIAEGSRPGTNPQRGGSANQGEGTAEGVVGQATEAVRNVAESASDLARDTYETGAGYVRGGLDRYPEAGRYFSEGSQLGAVRLSRTR